MTTTSLPRRTAPEQTTPLLPSASRLAMLPTLDDIYDELRADFGHRPMSLGPIVTRVLLRTGVNLKAIRPDQSADPAAVAAVRAVLGAMATPAARV